MEKIKTIIRKEWAEVFKNRMVLFTVAFLPLIMTALPLGILLAMGGDASMDAAGSEMPDAFNAFCPPGLNGGECFQVYMVSQFMIMFMIIPLAIPSTIASYSIVGEKSTRSLEPLLATPITTVELLVGKCLAAVIPAVIATYAGFIIYAIGAWLIVTNRAIFAAMMDARWLIAIFVVGPLMALLSVTVSVMVSSRVNDPRVAEQLSMIVILPVLAFFFGQLTGLFIINKQVILVTAVVLIFIDAGLVYLAAKLFQRETILTRWK
ncbi:MAG: ABC transporter permease subunit [Anaerolineales bacterium]|nr:ABC transporter permease subunit [Anaerolineales bacterium]